MPESQIGLKFHLRISNTQEIELTGQLARQTLNVVMDTFVLITCGLTMINMSQEEDAGSLQFVQIAALSGCSMVERFNGSVIHSLSTQLMVWSHHTA